MKEEEVDSWIASLRVVACKGCKKTLTAAELSISQLNKSVHRRRCEECAAKHAAEQNQARGQAAGSRV